MPKSAMNDRDIRFQVFCGGGGDGDSDSDSTSHDDHGEDSGPDSPEVSTPSEE